MSFAPPKHVPTRFLESIPEDLHRIAHELSGLTHTWNIVEIVTASPESRKREFDRFIDAYLQGIVYHPTFDYPFALRLEMGDTETILPEFLRIVRTYKPTTRAAAFAVRALRHKIQDDLATVWLVRGIQRKNDHLIGQALRSKYGTTDATLIRAAKADFHRRVAEARTGSPLTKTPMHTALNQVECDAPQVKTAFEWALKEYDMLQEEEDDFGFKVRVDDDTAFIDVRDKSMLGPTIFIPDKKLMSGDELVALIAHEIEGHARQTMNGELLLGVWNSILRVDDETYYEGLAMRYENNLKEEMFGIEARPSSLYAFAIHNAERGGSFHAIFDVQFRRQLRLSLGIDRPEPLPERNSLDHVLVDQCISAAWNTTYRVLRGHIDMSNKEHYAMPKDLAYLRGWLLDHDLCACEKSFFNECGIMTHRGMELLADFGLEEHHVPIPYRNIAEEYAKKHLLRMNDLEAVA
jgi:hypothetical protein